MEYVTQGEPAQGRVLALYFTISGSETDSSFVVWCAVFVLIQSGIALELFYVIGYLKTECFVQMFILFFQWSSTHGMLSTD